MRRVLFISLCLFVFMFLTPVYAKSSNIISTIRGSVYLLDEEDEEFEGVSNVDEAGIDMGKYNQEQNCQSLLGNPSDPDSVAWLLQEGLNIAKIVGPLLVVVLSSFDFAKVIISGDDDAMTKAGKKLGIRLALAVALFFVPILVTVLLDVFGIIGDPTCGLS